MATRYITGATNPTIAKVAFEYDLGLLLTPETAPVRIGAGYNGTVGTYGATTGRNGVPLPHKARRIEWHPTRAYDNGAYSEGRAKDGGIYDPDVDWLPEFRAWVREHSYLANTTEFFVCPDRIDWFPVSDKDGKPVFDKKGRREVFPVGDALGTLEWATTYIPIMRAIATEEGWPGRLPIALVAGDGMEDLTDLIPWDDIDWIFLGGSTDWKIGYGAERVCKEARVRDKKIHMGRVSSMERMLIANGFGCDTADGTYLRFGTDTNLPSVMEWVDATHGRDPLPSYAAAKALSIKLKTAANAKRKAKKVRSLAGVKAAKTRAANKAKIAALKEAA